MAKTRFTKNKFTVYLDWMMEQYDAKVPKLTDAKVLEAINKILRKKYPEEDMVVLRKYELTRKDRCLRLVDPNGAFFGVDIEDPTALADIPGTRGCYRADAFQVDKATRKIIEDYEAAKQAATDARNKKYQDYRAFLNACKNIEEANDIVPLPEALLRELISSSSTALIAFNPELLQSVKNDFSVG